MHIRNTLFRVLPLLLSAALVIQAPLARAGIVDTDSLAAPTQVAQDRAKVQAFLEQATVRERLQALGVGGLQAQERVAAMTQAEVHALAERIDAMPAGGALSNTDLILILLIAILVAIAL